MEFLPCLSLRMRFNYLFCFCLIFILNIAIGFYGILHNGLTSDEPAYIGAAYSYAQGLGVNPEHPLFFKLLNSLWFRIQFPQIKIEIPDPRTLDSIQSRLAAFDLGYQILMYFPEQYQSIVAGSRLIYLGINSLIFIWLYIYSFIFKLLNRRIVLIFCILLVFSPSFASHNALIAFDVGVAVSALMTILSIAIAIYSATQSATQRQAPFLNGQFAILAFSLCFAINTKFSNLILLPIGAIALGITSFSLWKTPKKRLALHFSLLSLGAFAIQPLLIWGMYRIAFGNWPGQTLPEIMNRYLEGIRLTLISAKGEQIPFLQGQFTRVNYAQYVSKIIWFKENIGLFLILALVVYTVIKISFFYKKKQFYSSIQATLKTREWRTIGGLGLFLGLGLVIAAYPILYFSLAKNSYFVIGYRYFYPILIFIYFLIAVLAARLRSAISQKLLVGGLALYIVFGTIAIPQTLSYVNSLWLPQKWLLGNDSTLNWGQENRNMVDYLFSHRLVPSTNQDFLTYRTFDVVININQYIEIYAKNHHYDLNIQSYYQQPRFEPLQVKIETSPYQYLIIDSSVKQTLFFERERNAIAAQNWDYLQTHQPIYAHNDIIFLYKLH